MKRLVVLFLIVASCAGAPKTSRVATSDRDRLFPFGTYRHKVDLTVKLNSEKNRSFKLDGIVDLREEKIQVIGISAFGTTEFKIVEDRKSGAISIEIYRDQLKKAENRFRDYYSVLRRLLDAKMKRGADSELVWAEFDETGPLKLTEARTGSTFYLSQFDRNKIPTALEVHHREFSALIKVVGYEL